MGDVAVLMQRGSTDCLENNPEEPELSEMKKSLLKWNPKCTQGAVCVLGRRGPEVDGLRSWILCLSASVNLLIEQGFLLGCSAAIFGALLDNYKQSKEETAWVGSISMSMTTLPGPLIAIVAARYGSRKTVFCGAVLMAIGFLATSFASSLLVVYITFGLIAGLGGGCIYMVSYTVVTPAFNKYRSFAVGILSAGPALGFLSLPLFVRVVYFATDIKYMFRVMAGTTVVCCFLSCAYPSTLEKDNDAEINRNERKLRELETEKNKKRVPIWKIPTYMVFTTAYAIAYMGYYIPFSHMLRHAEEQGVSEERTSTFFTYFGAASVVGRLLFGKLSDSTITYFLPLYIAQACLITIGIATIVISHQTSYPSLLAYFILYGFLDGGVMGQQCVIVHKCVGPNNLPLAWGVFAFCYSLTTLVGSPLGGYLADVHSTYRHTFYFSGGIMIFSSLILFIIPRVKNWTDFEEPEIYTPTEDEEILVLEKLTVL